METKTAEMRKGLLGNVLDQEVVSVFQDKNMSIQRLPHHAQSAFLRAVLTMNAPFPENTSFAWNGLFTQRVKGYWYGSY